MKYLFWACLPWLLVSCSSLTFFPASELKSGYYLYRDTDTPYEQVYVEAEDDSATIVKVEGGSIIPNHANQKFQKRNFDADILVIPFKFRPSSSNFPRQLTNNFNGSIFLGYRVDRFRLYHIKTPLGVEKQYRQRAITVGAFGGIGTASITPWTTNYQTMDEYNGFVFNRGLSAMFGVNSLTVGVGIGWDYLTDRDKKIWIYQNKPWYGLTLSLHLN